MEYYPELWYPPRWLEDGNTNLLRKDRPLSLNETCDFHTKMNSNSKWQISNKNNLPWVELAEINVSEFGF